MNFPHSGHASTLQECLRRRLTPWRRDGRPLLVACSAGRDSMALLHACLAVAMGPIVVCQVDHGWRRDSADDGAWLAQQLARWWAAGLPVSYAPRRLAGQRRDEASARQGRYAALAEVAEAHRPWALVVGHHQDDQAETVLLQCLRGSGSWGRAGMPPQRDWLHWDDHSCPMLRPWLDVPGATIATYAQHHSLGWRQDPSNQDLSYKRNLLRHTVLPRLISTTPNLMQQLARAAQRQYLRNQRQQRWADEAGLWRQGDALHLPTYHQLISAGVPPDWLLGRALVRWGWANSRGQRKRLAALLQLLQPGQLGQFGQPGKTQHCLTRHDQVLLWADDCVAPLKTPLPPQQSAVLPEVGSCTIHDRQVEVQLVHGQQPPRQPPAGANCDHDSALWWRGGERGELHWRLLQPGDRWQALGAPGHKSLARWLREHGVNQINRAQLAVVADDHGPLWVPGFTIAERVRVTPGNQDDAQRLACYRRLGTTLPAR